ncbi:MAG: C25 family cysteine peptidase [Bacteroidales bacterium]|nr:C25 family cysteine peptidase [Bacteroidales bacterium]
MKKTIKNLLLGLLLISSSALMAQSVITKSSDYRQSSFSFVAPQLNVSTQQANGTTFTTLQMQGAAPSHALGRPNLPIISQFIEIPICSAVKVDYQIRQTKTLDNLKYPVMPAQPAPSKSQKGALPFVYDSAYYQSNNNEIDRVVVETMGISRDRNVAILRVNPVIYDPTTGSLQLITAMDITLQFENADIAATQQLHSRYYSPDFSLGHKIEGALPCSKEIRSGAPIHYLIVAHSSFRDQLNGFINWKKRQGFIVTVGYTDDPNVGTTSTSIAQYTKSFYTNATEELPAPTYLLLVGDVQQIPAFNARCTQPSTDHVSDLYYTTWTDGDNIPDCYIGRFSARTVDELIPQIEKTLLYEGYNFPNDSYLSRGILIAGEDQGYSGDNAYRYSDPTMDYIAKTYVNASNGYTTFHYFKNNINFAPTGVTVDGSCSAAANANILRNYYNDGYGLVNYSAHGYDDEWSKPSFNANHASAMTNRNMPSIMIGNCCLSGKFNTRAYDECLGEALLRKGNNAGAVAYFGATNSTYWPHDFSWSVGIRSNMSNTMDANYDSQHLGMYDRLFHTHNEPFSAWHITAGAMNVAGNTAVQEYGSYQLYYWEIYELFGDPSLMPWLGTASTMELSSAGVLPLGSGTYSVTAVPYAYVALTTADEHDLIAATYADAQGVAELTIPSDICVGEYELSAWAQNYKPAFQTILVSSLDGPYALVAEMQPTESIVPGQVNNFNVKVVNMGNSDVNSGHINFESANENSVIVNTSAWFNNIAANDTITLNGICPIYVPEYVTDGKTIKIKAICEFGGNMPSQKNFNFEVSTPKLVLANTSLSSDLLPGTTTNLTCVVANTGSKDADNITLSFEYPFEFINITPADNNTNYTINASQQINANFNIQADATAPLADIPVRILANSEFLGEIMVRCGHSNLEDFESNSFNTFNWNMNNYAWEITNSNVHAGTFSARSKSNLGDNKESEMSITWTSSNNDTISFYHMVSSESGYDKFTFSIDGNEVLETSGNEDWSYYAYAVSAGTHNFVFKYTKDYSASRGQDCAWLDNIRLPFNGDVCTFIIDTVCQQNEYTYNGNTINLHENGTRTYSFQDGNETDYVSITVLPAPDVTIERINCGGCFLLKANGATSYVWSTGDQSQFIIVCPEEVTTYSVTGYRNGCSGEATTTVLDINDVNAPESVALYPNPATDRVIVAAHEMKSIQLLNLMGQVIYSTKSNTESISIYLQSIPTGIYLVRVETAHGVVVKKLVRK